MDNPLHSVTWMRTDQIDGVSFEQVEQLSLSQAQSFAKDISNESGFLAGQIIAEDGKVVANFAQDCIRFN